MAQRKQGGGGQQGYQSVLDLSGKDAPMLASLQKRLGQLVGQSSGYFESLPKPVQDRVRALKHLHKQRADIERQFNKELEELEKKYEALYQPFYERRSEIVTGKAEPKPEELVEEEKTEQKEEKKSEAPAQPSTIPADAKGVPEFWLLTLVHNEEFGMCISERDTEALKHLIDIKVTPNPESVHGFILEFHFEDNEFFEDKVLKKAYFMNENPADGEVMYDHVDCTKIKWKPGKNLTVQKVTKKTGSGPRKGGKRGGRGGQSGGQTVTVEEPTMSFFNFFNAEVGFLLGLEGINEEYEDEDMALQEILEADYEMALDLKEKIIPNAVMFYTGDFATFPFGEEDDEDDEDEDEDEDDDEDDERTDSKAPTEGGAAQQNPECKQQ